MRPGDASAVDRECLPATFNDSTHPTFDILAIAVVAFCTLSICKWLTFE